MVNDTVKEIPGGCAVVHGHAQKEGSETDKPKGTVIKKFTGPGACEKAAAMHYAIVKSQERARDRLAGK